MKIQSGKLIYYILLFIVILNLHLLDFGNFSSIYRGITAVLSVVLAIFCFVNRNIQIKIQPYIKFINKFIILFFGFYIIESLYGLAFADIGWINYISRLVPYTYIFLAYPLIYILQNKKTSKHFLYNIFILSVITLVIKTFIWWRYNYYGQDIMHYVLYEQGDVWRRNGMARIPSTCLNAIYIASCVVMFYFGRVKEKVIGAGAAIFIIWYANYVVQSRALIITIGVSIFLALGIYHDTGWKKIVIVILISIFTLIFLKSAYFDNLVSGLGFTTYSTSIRMQGFSYYFSCMKGHWLLGLIPLNTYEGIRSFNWRYYLSDLGMFSILFEYGVIGVLLFNFPVIRMISVYIRSKSKDLYLLSVIPATVLFSYMSNNIYLVNNILALPVIMAYVEVFNIQKERLFNPEYRNTKRIMD